MPPVLVVALASVEPFASLVILSASAIAFARVLSRPVAIGFEFVAYTRYGRLSENT